VVPIVVVVTVLNVFRQHVVVALFAGSVAVALCNRRQWRDFPAALTDGAKSAVTAIIGTCSAVGFGSVVQAAPGFAALTGAIVNMKGGILVAEAAAVNLICAVTASATGGLSTGLTTLAPAFLQRAAESGIDPAAIAPCLHRIAAVASGGLDSLPHNGAILTILAITNCTHKESYYEIAVTATLLPCVVSLVVAGLWGFFLA
jgi:H+/gluconate symporter-like permease